MERQDGNVAIIGDIGDLARCGPSAASEIQKEKKKE